MIWNDKLELGIKDIDEQHKKLVDLIEKTKELVYDAEDGIDCYDEIVYVLKELVDYTVYHFSFEEELMEKVNYDELVLHKMEHKIFVKKVSKFMSSDLDENQIEKIEDITVFLLDWITKHILETDKKYVNILKDIY